jgi:hypothetical protein
MKHHKPLRNFQRVSRYDQQKIRAIAWFSGMIIAVALLIQLTVWFINVNDNSTSSQIDPKVQAEIEIISGTMRGVPVFIFLLNESLYAMDYSVLGVTGGKPKFYPFFYKKPDAEQFLKSFIKDSNVKVQSSNLGFIYKEFRKNGDRFDYLVFRRNKSGELIPQNFTQIPVYYGKNSQTNTPLYLEENGKLVAVPYFLSRTGLDEVVASKGKEWRVVERNMLSIVHMAPNHEIGQYIQVVPPD